MGEVVVYMKHVIHIKVEIVNILHVIVIHGDRMYVTIYVVEVLKYLTRKGTCAHMNYTLTHVVDNVNYTVLKYQECTRDDYNCMNIHDGDLVQCWYDSRNPYIISLEPLCINGTTPKVVLSAIRYQFLILILAGLSCLFYIAIGLFYLIRLIIRKWKCHRVNWSKLFKRFKRQPTRQPTQQQPIQQEAQQQQQQQQQPIQQEAQQPSEDNEEIPEEVLNNMNTDVEIGLKDIVLDIQNNDVMEEWDKKRKLEQQQMEKHV